MNSLPSCSFLSPISPCPDCFGQLAMFNLSAVPSACRARWPHRRGLLAEHHSTLQTEKQSLLRATLPSACRSSSPPKYKQRTATVKLMVRRQLHCQTSLITSSLITGVFKHLRFKRLYTMGIRTYGVHHTAEHDSVVLGYSSKLAW